MTSNEMIKILEQSRAEILALVNAEFDKMKALISNDEQKSEPLQLSVDIPLLSNGSLFKGKKPLCILFENGEVQDTLSWKKVAKILLEKCRSNPETNKRLGEICGLISGKNRILFGWDSSEMNYPIEVDGMYLETKLDTETLMNVLVKRILIPAGFDGRGVSIKVR